MSAGDRPRYRAWAETTGGDCDWIIHLLCRVLVDAGRADDALTYIDGYFTRHGSNHQEQAGIGDLGAAKSGVVRGFAGPLAAFRRHFATLVSTVCRRALTHPSTHSPNKL